MKINEIGVVVTLDDGKTREVFLTKEQRDVMISTLTLMCNPIKVSDKPLNGIELVFKDRDEQTKKA